MRPTILLLVCAACAIAADPVISVETVRVPIQGRNVRCFAVTTNQTLTTALTINLTYGGTAAAADYTAPAAITLSSGMTSSLAVFLPIKVTGTATADRTISVAVQTGSGYSVSPSAGVATATVADPMANTAVYALGEPAAVSVGAGSTWTYALTVRRPSQLQDNANVPTPIFSVIAVDAPDATTVPFTIVITPQSGTSSTAPFTVTATPGASTAGKQYRFSLQIRADVDGDQSYIPYQEATSNGTPSEDIFTRQDIVLAVTAAGAG